MKTYELGSGWTVHLTSSRQKAGQPVYLFTHGLFMFSLAWVADVYSADQSYFLVQVRSPCCGAFISGDSTSACYACAKQHLYPDVHIAANGQWRPGEDLPQNLTALLEHEYDILTAVVEADTIKTLLTLLWPEDHRWQHHALWRWFTDVKTFRTEARKFLEPTES